jgi:hypothetical protein
LFQQSASETNETARIVRNHLAANQLRMAGRVLVRLHDDTNPTASASNRTKLSKYFPFVVSINFSVHRSVGNFSVQCASHM